MNRQAVNWLEEATTTHEMSANPSVFSATPLSATACRPFGATTVDVTAEISGGPVEIRVVEYANDGTVAAVLRPRELSLVPPNDGEPQSFAGTFVKPFFQSVRERSFTVEWRSVNGDEVTLHDGVVRVIYGRRAGDKGACD